MSRTRRSDIDTPGVRVARCRRLARHVPLGVLALLPACEGSSSMLDPAGEGARRIAHLAWFLIVLAAVVYVIVMALLVAAVARNRHRAEADVDLTPRSVGFVVIGGAVLPALILGLVFVVSLLAMPRFPTRDPVAVQFTITGHQWWWNVEYDDPRGPGHFRTANELHIPVGRPVRLRLLSADVIHSFWVPQLQGKIDLIPGDTNEVAILAERAGSYRGQCAEFCGTQHAHMAFTVVAEPMAAYRTWLAAQQAPAREPADTLTSEGRQLVVSGPCALCHTIRGTDANASVGPDLTHVAARRTLAAGTLPNTPATMQAWITNAQSLKPGTRMPSITQFNGRELRAMAAYLETLR